MHASVPYIESLFTSLSEVTSLLRSGPRDTEAEARLIATLRELLQADEVRLLRVQEGRLVRVTSSVEGATQRMRLPRRTARALSERLEAVPDAGERTDSAPDAGADFLPGAAPEGSRIAVPLQGRAGRMGLLVAERGAERPAFDEDAAVLLRAVAGHLAVVLENHDLFAKLQREAATDGLTGILNFRALMKVLHHELHRARRHGQTFAFVMADVDHLKHYNERFGHLAGSQVLARIGQILAGETRTTDVVGKYGGDEFAMILPQTNASGARAVTERVRAAIEAETFEHVARGEITCSFGIAQFPSDAEDVRGLVRCADQVLFQAKAAGKNAVFTVAEAFPDTSSGMRARSEVC